MPKKINITLSQKALDFLTKRFKGDEKAIENFVNNIIEKEIDESGKADTNIDSDDLEEYLKKGKSGHRAYGIKGQGW